MMKNNSSVKCKQEALWTSQTLANVFHYTIKTQNVILNGMSYKFL